tara:strand:+ start:394 stop:930 length:537 start_codon:yes stop_codon:yes gene_type:complete
MKYILVALKAELPEHNLDPAEYKVWYTGVGKVNATMWATMACIQHDCDTVINYGTAGGFNKDLAGQLLHIGNIRQRDMDARPQAELGVTPFDTSGFAGDIKISNSAYSVSSGDNFVKAQPELESDCVDMEAYGIAKVCHHFQKNFVCYKYISDLADEDAPNTWAENQHKGADAFLAMT